MDARTFERIIEQAIARIPPELAGYLENVLIAVQPSPSPEMLEEMGYAPDEILFGLFTGVPLNERSPLDPPLYPATIYGCRLLFRNRGRGGRAGPRGGEKADVDEVGAGELGGKGQRGKGAPFYAR